MAAKLEKETIINFNEEEEAAYIWTASSAMMRKYKRAGLELIQTNKDLGGREVSWELECLKEWIEAREPKVRSLNKEQKEERAKRLSTYRFKHKISDSGKKSTRISYGARQPQT